MITIENDFLKATIKNKGAELVGLYNKQRQLDYMWSGDPAFWGKHSPVLFPIVGALKNNTYYYNGKPYSLPRHGFARDMEFEIAEQHPGAIRFLLQNNAETEKVYPFRFNFYIIYTLENATLTVTYKVENRSNEPMWFSVGAHPAFKIPLLQGTSYEDYSLVFNQPENLDRWPISPDGLIEAIAEKSRQQTDRIALSKTLFYRDALVFKKLNSDHITLKAGDRPAGLDFHFPGFPYLGIWAAKDANFVCIEPWCGVADSVNTSQQLQDKEGINELETGEAFERSWSVKL